MEHPNLLKLARLHAFSPVAISLLHRLDNDDVSIKEIVGLVESDAALAVEILAYVNSPLFAMGQTIVDLQQAIVALGLENTKSIATTLATRAMLKSAPKPAVARRIWRHSIATSMVARQLAPVYGVSPDLAGTAGILHDVGRIGLLAQYGEEYAQFVVKRYTSVDAILEGERETFALDHCDVGKYLGVAWTLPDVFHGVISRHHAAKGEAGITGLINLACALADDLSFDAIAHEDLTSVEQRITDWVGEPQRIQLMSCWRDCEQQIRAKVDSLDF